MSRRVVVAADAGPGAGLGHVSRSSGLAAALRARGLEVDCLALGAGTDLERDGLLWRATDADELARPLEGAAAVVLDSYRLGGEELATALRGGRSVVAMHDFGPPLEHVSLVVSPAAAAPRDGYLCGFRYVSLRALFWGIPRRVAPEQVETVLVAAGAGDAAEQGGVLAAAVRAALPDARVRLVVAAGSSAPDGVEPVEAPESLLDYLLEADLVVTAGGQTMLEALAAGAPCVAIPLVENQRRQTERLAGEGAVELADVERVEATVRTLAGNLERRRDLARRGAELIDGFGALRVAYHVDRLALG